MGIAARVTSKGQVTVPKRVREALGISDGDSLMFIIRDNEVLLEKTPNFLDLAGSVPVPDDKRNLAWDDVRRQTREEFIGASGLKITPMSEINQVR